MLVVAVGDVERRHGAIDAALTAGVDTVQLRDRHASGAVLVAAATVLRELVRRHGARLLVNDRIDVARAVDADGVHLPADSFPLDVARRLVEPGALLGRSTHDPAAAAAAAAAGADYVVLGPIFPTPAKARFGPPLGTAALAATRIAVPLLAIGGVTVEHVPALREAGASGIAVIRAILDAPDPGAAARALIAALA